MKAIVPDAGSGSEIVRIKKVPEGHCKHLATLWGPLVFSGMETQGANLNLGLLHSLHQSETGLKCVLL